MENTVGSNGISITMPFWVAGNNMKISDNILNVTKEGIFVSLGSGGVVTKNDIVTTGFTGVHVRNSPGLTVSDNDIAASGLSDGTVAGSIYMENSPSGKLVCNTTDGNGSGGGLVFMEGCDGSLIARNTMKNHVRGLSVYSLNGDGVVGPQTYRDNQWHGGTVAEASMGSLYGLPIDPEYFLYNQFIIERNSGSLWPQPIDPPQSSSGSPDEWFFYRHRQEFPELCAEMLEEPTDPELTLFEEGIINEEIGEIPGAEGKYRDIDFAIYYKFRKDPSLLTSENEAYFDELNTASFQKRYDITVLMEEVSSMSNTLSIDEHLATLSSQLEWLALYDDGMHGAQRDSVLDEVKMTLYEMDSIMAPYRSSLDNKVEAILQVLQNWEGEEAADEVLKEVLAFYFNNFGLGFDSYSEQEQNRIMEYAGLCALEYGTGVYLANAIAETLHGYALTGHCLPSSERVISGLVDTPFGQFEIFPSPSKGIVNIRTSKQGIKAIHVFDALGNRIPSLLPSSGILQTINLEQEPAGLYFIEIIDKNGGRQVEKVLLQK